MHSCSFIQLPEKTQADFAGQAWRAGKTHENQYPDAVMLGSKPSDPFWVPTGPAFPGNVPPVAASISSLWRWQDYPCSAFESSGAPVLSSMP